MGGCGCACIHLPVQSVYRNIGSVCLGGIHCNFGHASQSLLMCKTLPLSGNAEPVTMENRPDQVNGCGVTCMYYACRQSPTAKPQDLQQIMV